MAQFDDQGNGGFGLRLFKSSNEAKSQVASKAQSFDANDPYSSFGDASASAFGAEDPYSAFGESGTPAAKPKEQGDFARGLSVSGKQLKQTAYGTAALIGDTVGYDALRDFGLKGYKKAEEEVQAISKDTDSFTSALDKGVGGITDWLQYSSGYLLGQVGQMGAASLAGAAVGTLAAPGAGTATGAIVGAVEKQAAQTGIKKLVGEMIDKRAQQFVKEGMAKDIAAEAATRSVYRTIGATTANTFLNATQELGSIYGDAVQEAISKGEDYSLGRVWLAGVAATAVDSWADSKALGGVLKSLGGTDKIKGVAFEALKGGLREGLTEGSQTVIERWGADKDLASKEAFKEYIDSAAVGILGGGITGSVTGAINKFTRPDETTSSATGQPLQGNDITIPTSEKNVRPDTTNLPRAVRSEVVSVLRDENALAYLYNTSNDTEKKQIETALQRFGDPALLEKVKDSKSAFDAGAAALEGDDGFVTRIRDRIAQYAEQTPAPGLFKAQPKKQPTSEEKLAEAEAATQALYGDLPTTPPGSPAEPVNNTAATSAPASAPTAVAPMSGLEADVLAAEQSFGERPQLDVDQMLPESLRGARVNAGNRLALEAYFEEEVGSILPRKETKAKQNALAKAGQMMRMVGFSQAEINQVLGTGSFSEPAAQVAEPQGKPEPAPKVEAPVEVTPDQVNAEIAAAKEELADAAYDLWDVYTDASGMKTNITGQKYTYGDLPKALERVMAAVVKLGYVKFKDVVREVMKRMRASPNWSQMVGSVTPSMLRQAYNNLPNFEGKESLESVQSVPKAELAPLVKIPESDLQGQVADLEFQVAAENDRLNKQYGKLEDGQFQDWAKADVPSRELDRLNSLKEKLKTLTDESKEEAQFAKPDPRVEGEERADDNDMGQYRAQPKAKPKTLTPSETTPAMREYLSGLNATEQKEAKQRLADMTAQERDAWEKRYLENKAKAEQRAADAEKGKQEEMKLEGGGLTQAVRELERKVASIMNLDEEATIWKDTRQRIVDAIAEIDAKLRDAQYMKVGNKTFKAMNEADENAYLWSNEQGFGIPKDLPTDKLLAMRRSLNDDLLAIRQQSSRGLAALFFRSMRHIEYKLAQVRAEAIRSGMSLADADSVIEPSRQFIISQLKEVGGRKEVQRLYDTDASIERNQRREEVQTDEQFMRRYNSTQQGTETVERYRDNLINAIQEDMDAGRLAAYKLVGDLKDKRISDADALKFAQKAMQANEFTMGELMEALRASGVDFPQKLVSVSGQVAMQKRMVDFVQANGDKHVYREEWLRSMDAVLKADINLKDNFTPAEQVAYEMWSNRRREIANRRQLTDEMTFAQDVSEAFPNLLFTNYSLSQMRNPASIPERELSALRAMVGDLETAWFQDVAYALKTRPDMRDRITGEEGVVAPTEVEQFRQWIQRHENAVLKDAEVNSKAPYYQQLLGMDALPQEAFEKFRTEIAVAQQQDLDKIIANAQKLNDMIGDSELTKEQLEARIGEFMDGVMQEEMINGQTIDQYFGMQERGQATDTREGSVDELANEDAGFEFNDEYGTDQDGDPGELRFRQIAKPFHNAVVTAAQVQSVAARITASWKSAPKITVLQNASMLPEPMRSRVAEKLGAGMGAQGLFDSETGQVYLFSDVIASEADAEFVLFHEVYGHLGMRGLLGAKFDSFLENMYRVYPEVRNAADREMAARGIGKLEAIEEVLSDLAGQNQTTGPVKQFVGKVIAGLREIGLGRVADWVGKLTNAELAYHLNAAKQFAQNESYAAINGEPGVLRLSQTENIYEMFAQRGADTKAYARFNPVTQTWVVFTAEGSDIRGGYTVASYDNYETALGVMAKQGKVERRKRSGLFVDEKLPGDMPNIAKVTELTGMKRWMRDQITRFQNEYKPVFDVVDFLKAEGRLTENMDVKTALTLYERRTGAVVEDFRRKFVEPIMKLVEEANAAGADYGEINTFLLARHAEERNKQIARINSKMPDKGSGMWTSDARKYLEELQDKPFREKLEEIGRLTDKMSDAKLNYQVATGMITPKVAESLRATYAHYVNLSGQTNSLDQFDDPSRLAGGSKFNLKGKEARAFGRSEPASDILARTILGMEAALIRGQKNIVAQRLLAMLEANYDPNFAVINEVAYKRQIGEDGMVMETEDQDYIKRKDVMVAKVGGIPVTIRFKDTAKGSFADAIHGMVYPPEANALLQKLGSFNRVIGQMLTTWNPAWVPVNFARDVQSMYFNAASDGRITKDQAARMVKLLPKAIKVAYFMARNGKTGIHVDPELVRVYNEMKREGGLTSFLNRKDLEEQSKEIHKMLHDRTKLQNIGDQFGKIADAMELLTTPMEIAPRLAAYKVAREGGMSVEEAAKFSGEITVNFNMRGSSQAVRNLYLFFNPAVQGSAKLMSLFVKLNPDYSLTFDGKKAAKYALGFMALGAIANLVARVIGDDDEAGRNDLDKVPTYKRATSIVLAPNVPGAAIPIPYGWNAFYAIGHFAMDSMLGIQPISVSAKRAAKATFEAFTPLGTAGLDSSSIPGTLLKGVAPTAALPIVEWVMNENRFGAPIYRDDSLFGGAQLPNSESAFRSVSPISQSMTRSLNELTGGNKARSGLVDINPAAVDFLIGSYMPGLINEAYKGASVATRVAQGEDVKNVPLPLVDRLTAKVPDSYDAGAFRRARELTETRWNEWKLYPERRDELREELPGLPRAHAIVASTTQEIRKLRSDFAQFERNPNVDPAEVIRRKNLLRERETAAYTRAVKAVMEAGPEFRESVMASD